MHPLSPPHTSPLSSTNPLSIKLANQTALTQKVQIILGDSSSYVSHTHGVNSSLEKVASDTNQPKTLSIVEQGCEKEGQKHKMVHWLPLNSIQKPPIGVPKLLKSTISTQPTGYKRLQSLNDSFPQGQGTSRSNQDTSRNNQDVSLPHDSSLMIPNLSEQEQMLKKIEEKALQLKRKEKKEREILKQLRKGNEARGSEPLLEFKEGVTAKVKKSHRRVISGLSESGEEQKVNKLNDLHLKYVESQQQGERVDAYQLRCIELEGQLVKLQQQLLKSQEESAKIKQQHATIIFLHQQQEEENARLKEELEKARISLDELKQQNRAITDQYNKEQEALEKQRDLMAANLDHTQLIKSKHTQALTKLQANLLQLKQELTRKTAQISKLMHENEESQRNNKQLQEFLLNAEEHIRKVEGKFHQLNKDMTEKNLAYDFLWMQLHQGGQVEATASHKQQNEERGMKRNLSATTIKELEEEIEDIKMLIDSREREKERGETNLPITLIPHSPTNSYLQQSSPNQINLSPHHSEQEQELVELSRPRQPPLLQQSISDLLSSERNDEIEDMKSMHSKNSNASRMESSLGVFSEYSRAISTQSDVPHRQTEQDYRQKMRSRKLMAKLARLKH